MRVACLIHNSQMFGVDRAHICIRILNLSAGNGISEPQFCKFSPREHGPGPPVFTAPIRSAKKSVTVKSCFVYRVCTWQKILTVVPNLVGTD